MTMRSIFISFVLLTSISIANADERGERREACEPHAGFGEASRYESDSAFYSSLGIDIRREVSPERWRSIGISDERDGAEQRGPDREDSLSNYETQLPHTTQPQISRLEKCLLIAYLDRPDDTRTATLLAIHHLEKSLLRSNQSAEKGSALEHTIIALYFLNRMEDAGSTAPWVGPVLRMTQAAVDRVFNAAQPITLDENHSAHLFYRQTFHLNQEQNRYLALQGLLEDFYAEPRNVYTSFVLTANNLWVGGEADRDDPTTLYNFVLGSYFSLHTIDLAHRLELDWNADPQHSTRFRNAAILGGFSLLQRRWLATVHHDEKAIALIDEEHRLWRAIQPAFHAFTFGLPFFDGKEHFAEGLAAYQAGAPFCASVPVRTCSDLPRFPFNLLSFFLGYVDFLLKAGDLADAQQLMTFNQMPFEQQNFTQWTIGREAWKHRADNLEAIMALYQSDDARDHPVNFEMKRRKWGSNTTTCQECHQTQAKPQTEADINAPQTLPPPQVASVRTWPAVTTAWYGAVKRPQ